MRQVTIMGSRVLPEAEAAAIRAQVSERMRQRAAELLRGRVSRLPEVPERRSVAAAALAVEERLVKAFWTIARQPLGASSPIASGRCGIEYFHDRADVHARYSDAAGGKWDSIAPRPSLPSSKEIDAANSALDWLLLIDEEDLRRVLVIGATSKRGDAGRRINWIRLRPSLPGYAEVTVRTLQRRYQEALRIIVSELTVRKIA